MPQFLADLGVIGSVILFLATARAVRLITHDDFPLTKWIRETWVRRLPNAWGELMICPFCLAPYAVAVNLAWAWGSGLHWTWWLLNTWAALAYLAAIVVAYDQPE